MAKPDHDPLFVLMGTLLNRLNESCARRLDADSEAEMRADGWWRCTGCGGGSNPPMFKFCPECGHAAVRS